MEEALKAIKRLLEEGLTNTRPLFITNVTQVDNIDAKAIYAIEDTTFTTLHAIYDGTAPVGLTLPAGHIWYMKIKGSVKLASGKVIIYQNK